jgi:hypothetical protein
MAEGNLSAVTTQAGNFSDWRTMNQSFEDLAAYFAFFDEGSYTLSGSGEPELLRGVGVRRTSSVFSESTPSSAAILKTLNACGTVRKPPC